MDEFSDISTVPNNIDGPPQGSISEVVKYFLKLGLLGFGGPVALVGQMERELVSEKRWMTRDQMREAIAAPLLARHRDNTSVQGFVKGAYGAAIGTILGACIFLGRTAIGDWLTVIIGAVSLAILFRWKVSNPLLILATAAIGLIAYPLLQPAWVMLR
jgi:chromate transport protein ChrA